MTKISVKDEKSTNPVDDLAEFEIYKTQSVTDEDFYIGLVARFNAMRISCDDWSYAVVVRLKEATVKINATNARVSRLSRAGDVRRPINFEANHSISQKTEQKKSISATVSGNFGTSIVQPVTGSAKLEANALATKQQATNATENHHLTEIISSIEALPGNRWKLSDIVNETLGGKYEPDDHLCKLEVEKGRSAGDVLAMLYFYPRDLSLEVLETDFSLKKLIKEKPGNISVAKALLAKHLRDLNKNDDKTLDGRIALGISSVSFEVTDDDNQ